MSDADLTARIGSFLTLRHPFWVASAHYSQNEASIDAWQQIKPAAVTLKTSHKKPKTEEKDPKRFKTHPSLARFGRSFYCDGPKHKELLSYEKTAELLHHARANLADTKIGLSVISDPDQDYNAFRTICGDAEYCELNLKYSFRFQESKEEEYSNTANRAWGELLGEIRRFLKAFSDFPVFLKLSRELDWLPGTKEFAELLEGLKNHGKAGLIVANSLKMDVPSFIATGKEESLTGGVMCGEHLFDGTVALIEKMKATCNEAGVPIVATGGMVSMEQILMAMRAGACSVQLCTAFEYHQINYYNTLCWNLQNRIEHRGLKSFTDYLMRLRDEGVASIFNMPFLYVEGFWSEEAQRRILLDVRRSNVMDVFVMSGRTLSDKWAGVLSQRFRSNLGLRLLLPNFDGEVFNAIQKSWGLTPGPELEARKHRVREAKQRFERLWAETSEIRRGGIAEGGREAQLTVLLSDQCPFYSFYLFDDKVYVAPYPFTRPGELESPVYVFFAGSKEYERIRKESDLLFSFAQQTQTN